MKLDGGTLLIIGTIVAGLIWLIDVLVLKKRRAKTEGAERGLVTEIAINLFPVLLVVTVVKGMIVEVYRIPSESMKPVLEVDDYIVVTKYDYGLQLPWSQSRVLVNELPTYGDVVVFRHPNHSGNEVEAGKTYIKRLIGMAGDEVSVYPTGQVLLNGVLVEDVYADTPLELPEKKTPVSKTFTVKAGEYFVLGDNRNHSSDSRVWGTVSESELIGKAVLVALHCKGLACKDSFDKSRVGVKIQ